MRGTRTLTAAATLAIVAAVVAGCGSSGGSNAAGGSSGSGASSASGATIPVGFIASASGAQAASEGGSPKVFEGWIKAVNDAGGLAGHKLKGYVKDSAGSPATALSAVKELVEADHVVAIVGEQDNEDVAWSSYVAQKGIPVVGGLSINFAMVANPDFFPTGTNNIASVYASVQRAADVGKKMGLIYCAESPQCAQGKTLFSALGQLVGVDVAVTMPISASATDYTAICQKLKESGVESYEIATATAIVTRAFQACKTQGVTAQLIGSDGTLDPKLPEIVPDGLLGVEYNAPWFDDSTPATKAYRDFLAKYVPDAGSFDASNDNFVYVGGKLFEAAVKASGSSDVTAESVKKGLYALKGETLGGLTQPLTYTPGKPTVLNCWFDLTTKGGAYALTDKGLTPQCAPDAVITGVLSKLS